MEKNKFIEVAVSDNNKKWTQCLSRQRELYQRQHDIRSEFARDYNRILHCTAYRRLKHKTQVFLSPFNDHFRTRLTHTLEVSQIGRTIARALDLNEDLVEAISLGHDLGHTPFGHCGEGVLDELMPNGFHHNLQSVRVVEILENLNLCQETVDGILTHTWGFQPKTPEAQVVQLADKVAYINHDIEDSVRAGIIAENDLPKDCIKYFSSIQKKRLNKMIEEIIDNSLGKPIVSMSEEGWHYTTKLREWMFQNVYVDSPAKHDEGKAKEIIKWLFEYYLNLLSQSCDKEKAQLIICDYISGMTDRYAIEKFKENFIPSPMVTKTNDDYLFRLAKMIN